jgi:hypothetical protein
MTWNGPAVAFPTLLDAVTEYVIEVPPKRARGVPQTSPVWRLMCSHAGAPSSSNTGAGLPDAAKAYL